MSVVSCLERARTFLREHSDVNQLVDQLDLGIRHLRFLLNSTNRESRILGPRRCTTMGMNQPLRHERKSMTL